MNNFQEAVSAAGLPNHPIPPDGKIHRFGKEKEFWGVNYDDRGGALGNWKTGIKETWQASNNDLTQEERQRMNADIEQLRLERETEQIKEWEETAQRAEALWDGYNITGESAYLTRKEVGAYGVRFNNDSIVVPLRDMSGKLWSLQFITNQEKRFLKGGKKKGGFHIIGTLTDEAYLVEGYATGATIHEATGKPIIIAFDAGNLEPVVEAIKTIHPNLQLIVAGDNDQWKEHNTGKEAAQKIAKHYQCNVILPDFSSKEIQRQYYAREIKPTDWNDLHCLAGLDEVKRQLSHSSTLDYDKEIARLAALHSMEYDRVYKEEAKRLGVRTSTLDNEVKAKRKQAKGDSANKGDLFPVIDPWPEPINGETLLNELVSTIQRFIICERETAIAASLWCVFTWLIDHVQVAPLAVITAPEKGCGKSQLLDVIGRLAYRPLVAANITSSSMYRVIEAYQPTLLIDEADTFLKDNEELRGVINSGHTRQSAYVIRCTGDEHEPKQFSTWGAKALSGIGSLPDTISSRAIILEMRRKLPSESAERLRHVENGLFGQLVAKMARFTLDAAEVIKHTRPILPEALSDRAQDNWEPLLAIADCAGGIWPELSRSTALTLSGKEQETLSLSTELLADIQEVFDAKRVDRIPTVDLIEALCEDDLKPWATYNRGKPMVPRQLAKRLEEYSIKSKNIKVGYGDVKKGYERKQFEDAFARYISSSTPTEICRYPLPNGEKQEQKPITGVADKNTGSATKTSSATIKPAETLKSSGKTDKSHPSEGVENIMEIEL